MVAALAPAPAAANEPDGAWFSDHTAAAGIDFTHVNGMSGEYYFAEVIGSGVAVFDFDNDGDLDLYFPQGRMLGDVPEPSPAAPPRDRLYRNDLDRDPAGDRRLTFTDVTEASGLRVEAYTMGAATGDIDNDGWMDLYVTALGTDHLFRNNGDGTFTDVTVSAGAGHPRWSVSASFFDLDRDGWLDLYVGGYLDFRLDDQADCSTPTGMRNYCGPQRYGAVPDRLYRNRGNGTFSDVTATARVATVYGPALGTVALDVDADGWLDLYVANDGRENQLWRNQRDGTFRDEALLAGVALNAAGRAEAGMGVDAGDFDGDGDEDLVITHLATETNTLYVNDGSGWFADRTARAGLAAPSVPFTGFGTGWFDYDNDGWLDVLVVNGAVGLIADLVQAGDPYPLHQHNQLFRNRGDGTFEDVSHRAGPAFTRAEVSRGAAFGDLDNDGDTDVVITNNHGPARVLLNQVGSRRRWLGLRLVGERAPRDMLGARVGVVLGAAPPLWRRVHTDGSYASAHDPRVLVGLGDATVVDEVRVVWPDGRVEIWDDVAADQWLTLVEGTGRRQPE